MFNKQMSRIMKEIRVYVVNYDLYDGGEDLRTVANEDFMRIAEEQGSVYSLMGFQSCWNNWAYAAPSPDCSYIRILEVECAESINFEEWSVPSVTEV